nr:PREDICTED: uncharacterized protein LOC109029813 [Bemisia tabaci]
MVITADVNYYQFHTYQPYNATFNNNDEIRIPVNSQDLITQPGDSKLYVEGSMTFTPKTAGATGAVCDLSNNAIAFLFDQIRYEVSGVEIDRTRKVGLTSTAMILLTRTKEETSALKLAGWNAPLIHGGSKTFSALIPLDMLLGVFADFKEPLIRVRQELVLVRSRTNKDAYRFTSGADKESVLLTLTKVQWQMPQMKYNLASEKRILDKVKSNASFPIAFRSYETHVYPQLPLNSKETWKLMTTTNVEAPAYIIILFQTNRSDNEESDASKFDHVNLRSFRVHLNSVALPYENFNENFDKNRYLNFYQNYLRFITDFSHGEKLCEPALSLEEFKTDNPMFVMRCLYEESLKPGPLDIQIELETHANFPAGTAAYAILVHDLMFTYQSLSGIVKKIR